ncbi:TetR/AcrR family transcriptional regulator [Actinomycetota bacterium Odt1-20B]
MAEEMGLRERKKKQTALRIRRSALQLFVERGYDKVSVAEIAEAAEVSKMTVFNYFGTKEDILVAPMEEHVGDPARAVRERRQGEPAVDAVRRQFMEQIAARDASVGLSDSALAVKLRQLISETPALSHRLLIFQLRGLQLLTEALAEDTGDPLLARVAAGQLLGARNAVIMENQRRTLAGDPLDQVAEDAATYAGRAFDLVEKGLKGYAAKL